MKTTYASELAARGLGLAPVGAPHKDSECGCAMCCRPIRLGHMSTRARYGQSFTNYQHLAQSDFICGWCSATREQPVMRLLQRTCMSAGGCYGVGTDDARAWLFLTPPEPPFAVCINQASATATFHLHWRTPVTYDKDLLAVRVNEDVVLIRRPMLLKAVDVCAEVASKLPKPLQRRRDPPKPKRRHPFVALDRSLEASGHGVLLPQLRSSSSRDIAFLQSLWPGELWALATLAKRNAPTPTAPQRLTLKGSHA